MRRELALRTVLVHVMCENSPRCGKSDASNAMYGRDRVVQLYPPVSPYFKKSFEGILDMRAYSQRPKRLITARVC